MDGVMDLAPGAKLIVQIKAPVRLDIGGYGTTHRRGEEYTTIGLHPEADIQADMWDLPLLDASVEFIWSSHTLEHAPMVKVPATLKEWYRVLKPGARGIVQVPNFDYVARYWLTGADRRWAECMVFGTQENDGEFHKCAFTNQTLRADLEAAGFEVLRVEMRSTHNQETLQAVFRKPLKPVASPGPSVPS